jgi:hypothetical protein
MAKWSIEKRVALCGACEKEFTEGAPLYSLLLADEEGLHRSDLCAQCRTDEVCDAALFWWRTKFQEKKARGLQLDLEAIEALFIALSDTDKQHLKELRYLMCLILLRKRRVKVTKVARSHNGVEGEFFLVKRPRRDEQLAVEVFDFDAERIDVLREDLKSIFEGADPSELADASPEPAPVETEQVHQESIAMAPEGNRSDSTTEPSEQPGGSEVAQAVERSGAESPRERGGDRAPEA